MGTLGGSWKLESHAVGLDFLECLPRLVGSPPAAGSVVDDPGIIIEPDFCHRGSYRLDLNSFVLQS